MMMPSVFGESLFDDLMDFPFEKEFFGHRNPLYGKHAQNVMKTDIKESDTAYEMDIDLPGFKKEDVSAKLENGYLTISAEKGLDKDEQEKRFKQRMETPEKQWKITDEDWRNRDKWDDYEKAVDEMMLRTSTTEAPWHIIEANSKLYARIKVLEIVVEALEKRLE